MRVRFGHCVFDSQSRELTRDGTPVHLSPKAFAMLEMLVAASPAAVAKEALYERLWPTTFVEQGNLHNVASEIRTALGDDEHEILRTVHRFGYAFAAHAVAEEPVRFAVVLGDEAIPLREGSNVIGRDPAAVVVINAPDVSRHHARLIVAGGKVMLEDLASKNGTFIGTTPVTAPMEVSEHDDLAIGRTRIRLRLVRALTTTVTSA